MTVLVSLNSRSFAPQVSTIPFSVDAAATQVQVTLTHPNTLAAWPDGPLYQLDWDFGSGSTGTNSGGGGVRANKDRTPITGAVAMTFGTSKPPGVTSGTVTVTVLQTLTTALLVEAF
jgi:hypothetical protein